MASPGSDPRWSARYSILDTVEKMGWFDSSRPLSCSGAAMTDHGPSPERLRFSFVLLLQFLSDAPSPSALYDRLGS